MANILLPEDMHSYQRRIASFVEEHRVGNIWAGMGLGKTVSVLTAVASLLMFGETRKPLVIAPKRVANTTWPDEVLAWEHTRHLRVSCITGTARQRAAALFRDADIYTINYENLEWLVDFLEATLQSRGRWPFDMVIADESTKLKNPEARRVRAMRIARRYIRRWYNLSGTPAPRGLVDLWQQQWFLDSGKRLGKTQGGFEKAYFTKEGYDYVPKPGAEEALHEIMRDCSITLEAEDYLDLPPLVQHAVPVFLPPKLRKEYDTLERQMYLELEQAGEVTATTAGALSMKCRQYANGAVYYDDEGSYEVVHDLKLEALQDIVDELAGEPLLVGYYFKPDKARIMKRFPQARFLDDNPETIRQWNRGEIPILLAHPESAGHGLSLQHGGNNFAIFAPSWSLEAMQQILERLGPTRQAQSGYNRPVFVHRITADGTVEDRMYERLESRESVQDALLKATK